MGLLKLHHRQQAALPPMTRVIRNLQPNLEDLLRGACAFVSAGKGIQVGLSWPLRPDLVSPRSRPLPSWLLLGYPCEDGCGKAGTERHSTPGDPPMRSCLSRFLVLTLAFLPAAPLLSGEKGQPSGITVDKDKRTVTIACSIAPRKLPNLKQIYPIEVIATFPAPRGQKAHETVVNFDVKPSDVHKALVGLGLKPGKPGLGEIN